MRKSKNFQIVQVDVFESNVNVNFDPCFYQPKYYRRTKSKEINKFLKFGPIYEKFTRPRLVLTQLNSEVDKDSNAPFCIKVDFKIAF